MTEKTRDGVVGRRTVIGAMVAVLGAGVTSWRKRRSASASIAPNEPGRSPATAEPTTHDDRHSGDSGDGPIWIGHL